MDLVTNDLIGLQTTNPAQGIWRSCSSGDNSTRAVTIPIPAGLGLHSIQTARTTAGVLKAARFRLDNGLRATCGNSSELSTALQQQQQL